MKVYFISGMGADRRVFSKIRLPEGYDIVHLDWIKPLKKESLASYAKRLAKDILPGENYGLIGLSMGGMIACEIAKQAATTDTNNQPLVTILLSSVSTHKQLPRHFRVSARLKIYKIIPVSLLKSFSLIKRFFSTEHTDDKKILNQQIKDSDPRFVRWAIEAVLQWRNEIIPQPLYHIHGTKDIVLPIRFTNPTHIIKDGGHLMVMSNAVEINSIIEAAILSAPSFKR